MTPPSWIPLLSAKLAKPGRRTVSFRSLPAGFHMKYTSRPNGFTMIELMTVLALLMCLSTFTVISLRGTGGAAALTVGGNRIVGLVSQARQNSMTRNVMTALVLVTGQASPSQGDYRAAALLEYNAAEASPAWKQISQWEILPAGVVIDADSTFLSGNTNVSPAQAPLPTTLPAKFRGAAIANYAARVFLPNGGLYNPATSSKIQLVEGAVNGNSVTLTHCVTGGSAADFYNIAIVGITGRSKIERP